MIISKELICIPLTKNKTFEFEFLSGERTKGFEDFIFSLSHTSNESHAGPSFDLGIKNLFRVCFRIYDNRHWNYKKNCWEE